MKIKLITIFIFLTFLSIDLYPEQKNNYKDVIILGLKINTPDYLIDKFNIDKLSKNKNHFRAIAQKIESFYRKSGYLLVKSYLIEETPHKLIFFVDEGRLGRIVFIGLDAIDTIKIKYDFDLEHRIYNKEKVIKELKRLRKKYDFKDILESIKEIPESDTAYVQIDDKFEIPGFGEQRLPFFDEVKKRYNLEIIFVRKSPTEVSFLTYGFKTSYSKGLIPKIDYSMPSIIRKNDVLTVGTSFGVLWGLDLKFTDIPKWTFWEVHSNYYFAPMFEQFFTPMISASVYDSRASRSDIGLTSYNFLQTKGLLAPGFTILKKLKIFTGAGGEKVYILSPKIDSSANYVVDVNKHIDTWALVESNITLDLRTWSLKNTRKQKLDAVYDYYSNHETFHKLTMELESEMEFKNLDAYLLAIEFGRIWHKPPFYHEFAVDGANFKGFMGKSYHTRNMVRTSNEYKISVYRDIYLLGVFTDIVRFEGSGYDLNGYQNGIVCGVSGHIIFLDQFEFNIYYGRDYLFSLGQSQYNLYMNLHKKW